jgi:3-hydroxy-9,10-secoandrosta-1,3,5(10)-triene-9,17-dione monooxygenase
MNAQELIQNARDLAPVLQERAAQTEKLRRIPDETVKDLHEAHLFKVLQPKRYGGLELEPGAFYETAMALASGCGSTGWVYSILAVHHWQMALFPEQAQEEVWGENPSTLISSSYAATGQVEVVDGGFRLSGTWHFSSGCQHADWVFLGGLVMQGDVPVFHTFLVPGRDYRIHDVWNVVGLAGTGSNDIVIEEAFVPDHRAHRMLEEIGGPGTAVNTSPIYKLPFSSVFSYSITAPALGMALGAIEAYRETMRTRVRIAYGGEKVAQDPFSQVRLAEASGEVDAARLQMHRNFDEMLGLVAEGKDFPLELRTRIRRDQVRGTAAAIRATDRIFENSGGRALFLDSPIQRAWRDVHAARVHAVNDPERALRMYGGSEVGIEPDPGSMY